MPKLKWRSKRPSDAQTPIQIGEAEVPDRPSCGRLQYPSDVVPDRASR